MASQKLPPNISIPVINYIRGRDRFGLLFESDIDKATYFLGKYTGVTGSRGGWNESYQIKSEKKQAVWDWLQKVTGWNEAERSAHRKLILEEIRKLTKSNPDEFVITIPDLYSKDKQTEEENVEFDEEDEKIPEGLEDLLKEIESGESATLPKPKKTRAKKGELTKKQQEILHNILEDLIKIKHKLTDIKTNQEAKIAYEKKRDRLQAERLAFLERERQIEALPEEKKEEPIVDRDTDKKEESKKEKTPENKKPGWIQNIENIFKTSIIGGSGAAVLGGGGNNQQKPQQNQTPPPNKEQQNSPLSLSNLAKTAIKMTPIPGIGMIPFAEGGVVGPTTMLPFEDGGSITPLNSSDTGTAIQPLDKAIEPTKASGGTTFSRGFSMEDLKSPLAEVMKLPLKVAGAALLSAISKISSQFDVSDQKLQSDLSKMIGDVSRAFGLNRPTFGTSAGGNTATASSGADDEQKKLTLAINTVADGLVGSEQTGSQDSAQMQNQNASPAANATPSAPSSTAPAGTSGQSGTTSSTPTTSAAPPTRSSVSAASLTPSSGGTNTASTPGSKPAPAASTPSSTTSTTTATTQKPSTPKTQPRIVAPSSAQEISSLHPDNRQTNSTQSKSGMSGGALWESGNAAPNAKPQPNQTTNSKSATGQPLWGGSNSVPKAAASRTDSGDELWGTKDSSKTPQMSPGKVDTGEPLWGASDNAPKITPATTGISGTGKDIPKYIPSPPEPGKGYINDAGILNPEWVKIYGNPYKKQSPQSSQLTNNLFATSNMMMGGNPMLNYNTTANARFSPVSRQTNIANTSISNQIESLKADPKGKPIPSVYVSTGLIPNEMRNNISPMPNNTKFVTLPPQYSKPANLNTTGTPEVVNRMAKRPYGFNGISVAIRTSVISPSIA